jgi:cytochrome P450
MPTSTRHPRTLRVRPIVPLIGRSVAAPSSAREVDHPAGQSHRASIHLAGKRADAYPAPQRFEPERWIGVSRSVHGLPFGGGTRRCIGMAFAQFEMRVVLQTVVRRARMRRAWTGIRSPGAASRSRRRVRTRSSSNSDYRPRPDAARVGT